MNQGSIMNDMSNEDTTPAVDGPAEDLNIGAIEESDRKKRDLSDMMAPVNGGLHSDV